MEYKWYYIAVVVMIVSLGIGEGLKDYNKTQLEIAKVRVQCSEP